MKIYFDTYYNSLLTDSNSEGVLKAIYKIAIKFGTYYRLRLKSPKNTLNYIFEGHLADGNKSLSVIDLIGMYNTNFKDIYLCIDNDFGICFEYDNDSIWFELNADQFINLKEYLKECNLPSEIFYKEDDCVMVEQESESIFFKFLKNVLHMKKYKLYTPREYRDNYQSTGKTSLP